MRILRENQSKGNSKVPSSSLIFPPPLSIREGKRRQAGQVISEYAITIILIITTVAAMSLFLQRGLQAKLRDANMHMVNIIKTQVPNTKVFYQYEPYYVESRADIQGFSNQTLGLTKSGGGTSGRFSKEIDNQFLVGSFGFQAPPGNAE